MSTFLLSEKALKEFKGVLAGVSPAMKRRGKSFGGLIMPPVLGKKCVPRSAIAGN